MPAPNPVRELIRRELFDRVPGGSFQDRYELYEPFLQRPVTAATLDWGGDDTFTQAELRLYTGANKNWIISGTNAANSGSALDVDGGVLLTTAGADNDQVIVSPATAINSVDQSAWRKVEWEPEHAIRIEFLIELPSLANIRFHAGWGLTTVLDLTTDNDQAKLVFDTESATSPENWVAAQSVGGTDDGQDTGSPAVAGVTVRLGIEVNTSRVPRYYVNGIKKATGDALTAGANLIPFCGIQALEAAAKSFKLRGIRASRLLNDYTA